MSDPIAVISDAKITPQEFTEFLKTIGAEINPQKSYESRFSKGNLHVWIFLDNSVLEELEENISEVILQNFGNHAQTCIILEISRKLGSKQLALEFVCAFAKRWNCVVYNLINKIYSMQELKKLCIAGNSFESDHPIF